MPKVDHRLRLEDRATAMEQAVVELMRQLTNEVRHAVQPPLPPVTRPDMLRQLREILQTQAHASAQTQEASHVPRET